ncbi:MAG: 4-alpha-glucanotransferase, partial [Terriglobus roseus]|nr:4-alpha-glucanotransferase [Terriglobus roseus]
MKIEDVTLGEPGPGEVKLKVAAVGLNRAESMYYHGQYMEQPQLPSGIGYEVVGTITAVGPDVDQGLVGKQFATIPGYSMKQYPSLAEEAVVPASYLAAVPPGLSPVEGAAVWMQYGTAYGPLVEFGKVGAGDFVIITAASSSVGLAAIQIVKAQGGDAVGVNPLHGMFPDLPREASPYSPLSRYLLNVLNLDPEAIPEFAQSEAAQAMVKAPEFQERLRRVREAELVAYEEVAQLKTPVLRALYEEFEKNASEERKEAFARFQRGCDPLLTESCVFGAIRQHMTEQDPQFRDCGKWPESLKHAASDGVERFRQEQADLVRYHQWTQWVADEQLFAVKQACEGMAVGLYRDLAVGANPSGAEVWSNPEVMVSMAEVGAPPDLLNTAGQNWVLPPFHPLKMREDGYRSFIALLRTNMRHAGGVRIDHAMALERLYWIPRGGTPRDGGYVRYPTEDLIGVIALESHRNKCLVVGEDLGTVPKGFRERMAEAQILSYKVLLLEEEEKGGGYVKGGSYQRLALSTASSHDLPTLRGWWEGEDLRLRERLGFTKPDKAREDEAKREEDRESLV